MHIMNLSYRVYDNSLQLMQVSCGHTDTIKTIIHIPEREQVCVCVCVHACVRVCVRACVRACVRVCDMCVVSQQHIASTCS